MAVQNEWPWMKGQLDLWCYLIRFKVAMNIFRKKKNLFKSFVKVKLSYDFTINLFSTAENCMEK